MDAIKEFAQMINSADKITVLTGAGMSTESGIPDFRSENGIYAQEGNVEHYISEYYFETHPVDFWHKFKRIFSLKLMGNFAPNQGHLFLKQLEDMGKKVTILTQNIDGLHKKAGSSRVIELHGTLQTATCPKCQTKYDLAFVNSHDVPRCEQETCNEILKPDVVLFGGMVHRFEEALEAAYDSDLLIAMGTSLEVTPVNQIPFYVSTESPRAHKVIINKTPTRMDYLFDIVIHAGIGETVAKVQQYIADAR
ncbi:MULTISPECIES: NAD-dependent protein deacylase [Parageobacillus]|jgi:NAD-dependent deacetylase|uniref:NAD-dependent protein deacylase n=1 Tax=Parageobacillus TaxID=1906945 RepID=UPI0009BF7471|nr:MULTISPECIES: NAD-dependent protein deacylase [Parageobacillus]NNU93671.1 NAD-dependent protein deacylase [Geobacillus sp. NFOSA3]OQO98953.1 NAD-dependent protein deacylase [Geobacillus sp. 44C]MED4971391.1 NAD-dependent protein deacylase [Parageobacillus toebii]MED4990997.1 NAD-dependent protein deacylase [Parageobacillus toebii]QNU34526.1 NAD-dependent protein deacylase [Geobacillus sp. 44C]